MGAPRRWSARALVQVYGPKVFIQIGTPISTVADRCIHIRMKRRHPSEKVERFTFRRIRRETEPLLERAKQWAEENADRVAQAFEESPGLEFTSELEEELWLPLVITTRIVAPYRLADLKAAFNRIHSVDQRMKEQEKAERLLKDIRDVFTRTRAKQMSTVDLIDELHHVEDFDWSTLKPHRVSKLLKPFDVHPESIRVKPNERQPKRVARDTSLRA